MKKSPHEMVQRTRGRDTTNLDAVHLARLTALEQFNGRAFYRLPWREAANDAVCEMRRVG